MGRESKRIQIVATVSRHNSDQDRLDDNALETLRMHIETLIASSPEYARVVDWVEGP